MGLQRRCAEAEQTDVAYREAVGRLRSILTPTHASLLPSRPVSSHSDIPLETPPFAAAQSTALTEAECEVFRFIEKQWAYVEQLEKEAGLCRREMGGLLREVEELLAENEALREREMHGALALGRGDEGDAEDEDGGESGVVALQRELVQSRRSLRLAQEEVLQLRQERKGGSLHGDAHLVEIESVCREKEELLQRVECLEGRLQAAGERAEEAAEKVHTSLLLVDELREEKEKSAAEAQNLRQQFLRQHHHFSQALEETPRKTPHTHLPLQERRAEDGVAAEEELISQSLLQRQLRADVQEKAKLIDELRVEAERRRRELENEVSQAVGQKRSAEAEVRNVRLQTELVRREAQEEAATLHVELSVVRQRLAQSEVELETCQDVSLSLRGRISEAESLAAAERLRTERQWRATAERERRALLEGALEREAAAEEELAEVVAWQKGLLAKLSAECRQLAAKLEETSHQSKAHKTHFQKERTRLSRMHSLSRNKATDLELKLNFYAAAHERMTQRLQVLQDSDQAQANKVRGLMAKMSSLLQEKRRLEAEVAMLKAGARPLLPTEGRGAPS